MKAEPQPTRTYLRRRAILVGYLLGTNAFYLGMLVVIALFAWAVRSSELPGSMQIPLLVLFAFVCLMIFAASIYGLLKCLLTYVRVSHTGVECRIWPKYRVRCKWSDVEQLGKVPDVPPLDVLFLKNAEPIGRQVMMPFRRLLGVSHPHFILLSTIQGWPSGDFRDDLEKHLPEVFFTEDIK